MARDGYKYCLFSDQLHLIIFFIMDLYLSQKPETGYHLLRLTPELQKLVMKGNNVTEDISIKASDENSDAVLCVADSTFQLRQVHHTNTLLLTKKHDENDMFAFTDIKFLLECTKISPKLNINDIPIYNSINDILTDQTPSLSTLKKNSPMSDLEFDQLWASVGGCELNGISCILSQDLLMESLNIIITASSTIDCKEGELYKNITIDKIISIINDSEFDSNLIQTTLKYFSNTIIEPFELNSEKITKFYGIQALKKLSSSSLISQKDFITSWKQLIPTTFKTKFEISQLRGYYSQPLPNKIQYFPISNLSKDPVIRFKRLFKEQSSWELDDIIPYVKDLNTRNIKIESFIIKYARKKQIGKKIIISAR